MVRILVMIVIVALALFLVRSFMNSAGEQRPIDVNPVRESRDGRHKDDDDIIDVDPVE